MSERFGDLLREFRVAASLTQEELAGRCRISPATVAALEQGRRNAPRLSTVRLIASALELPATELGALARAASSVSLTASDRSGPVLASHAGRAGQARASGPRQGSSRRPRALPVPITPLFGRAAEADAVAQAVCCERLVTLVGSGGVGKTRLALQVVRDTLDKFAGGTWWVELGSVTGPDGLPGAVLRSLGASEQPGAAISEQLLAAMPGDPALLVVDNCEHVLDAAAAVIGGLLAHPLVTVLATSREPLAIPGEIRWPVPALGVPAPGTEASVQSLMEIDSVALFAERAARACPRFVLGDAEAGAVAGICRRLDGLPLALELAAARIGGLTPAQLAEELDERIPLVTAAARGVPGSTARCGPRSTGATSSSVRGSGPRSGAWHVSAAPSTLRPSPRSAPGSRRPARARPRGRWPIWWKNHWSRRTPRPGGTACSTPYGRSPPNRPARLGSWTRSVTPTPATTRRGWRGCTPPTRATRCWI